MIAQDNRRAVVDLLPEFLKRRRRGFVGRLRTMLADQLALPEFFLLQAIVQETDPGVAMTEEQLRTDLFNPYSTIHTFPELLPTLINRGYLIYADEGYSVTPSGRAVIEDVEREAHDYLATLTPIPAADLTRLADTLTNIAGRSLIASEPPQKPHQARIRRLPAPANGAAMARLERAVYELWTARDDAHNAAWRSRGFTGPAFDLLTRVWSGEVASMEQLIAAVEQAQRPDDVRRGVETLIKEGYLARDGERLSLTAHGQATRDWIEAETDRIYFAPWPALSLDDVTWLHATLQRVINGLPA